MSEETSDMPPCCRTHRYSVFAQIRIIWILEIISIILLSLSLSFYPWCYTVM